MELYINNETFGNVSYIGTRAQWQQQMEELFRDWYRDEADSELEYAEWVIQALDDGLRIATDDEIAEYPHL